MRQWLCFEWSVIKQCFAATWQFTKKYLVMETFVAVATTLIGGLNSFIQDGDWILAVMAGVTIGAGTILLLLTATFITAAVTAPYTLWKNQQERLQNIAEKKPAEHIVKELTRLLISGNQLMTLPITNDSDYNKLALDLTYWETDSFAVIGHGISMADAELFNTITVENNIKNKGAYNAEHNKMLVFHAAKLGIIKTLIRRYQDKINGNR